MKKASGSVLIMLLFLVVAVGGAGALAIGGINMVQRAVGAHTEEARQLAAEQGTAQRPTGGSATPDRPTVAAAGIPDADRQAWADAKVGQWLAAYGDDSLADLTEPYRHVEAWLSPVEGELELLTSSQKVDDGGDLLKIAREVMNRLAAADQSLEAVTVSTSDGTLSETVER
ncbi:hypothetical protein OK351_16120 [Glutamicibacter sp. MNS18]|uniref:hypothetical protein n=1 Tax=Glutamicibacter sp. MNS18 TaxID=2989817 RepID=UPI00223625A5|nr:hypothetical protein [Glutamicibacter sp. MNS18]MCW4467012.1 hypothetical protein [Glutamicibacter sp. MNS18]